MSFKQAIRSRNVETVKSMTSINYGEFYCDVEPWDKRDGLLCQGWDSLRRDFFSARGKLSKIEKGWYQETEDTVFRVWTTPFGEWSSYTFVYTTGGEWQLESFTPGCTA